ncbi:glutathione S-transferase family protein [Roseomonas stagni]|uniref:Glutathione S-transferase family protein n=1 Tax=Falsiroseomonas algicola TaxID=2716930 RepID=A0A6M1LFT4_9PROT|nr:glutathione S-transferase family protein [Falsiroseomonas algicola]NGM18909.1 glutathione S-transferase family protein [Falsiroseomonas algicola]
MILIGRNLSPFVRRVGASLAVLGIPYEQRHYGTVDQRAEILSLNPLGRVPALVMDDGEVLVDSVAILDAIDDLVGPDRALVPATGAPRRAAMRALALAVGATEKLVAAYQETKRRPAELVWAEAAGKLLDQAAGGFAALDMMAGEAWLCGDRMTQADITVTCALDFADAVLPDFAAGRFPALSALRDRANAIPAIGDTRWKG